MAILGLVTSGTDGRIGLQAASGAVTEGEPLGRAARGRDLVPAIHALLEAANLRPSDLSGIVADCGPGSFTGVRVGVTCAKTLAFALGIPVVGVSSLDLIAHEAALDDPVVAIRDAGRATLYVAKYGARADGRPLREPPRRAPADEVFANEDAVFFGEDAVALATPFEAHERAHNVQPTLATVFALGVPRLKDAPSAHTLAPVYLQASAPERLRAGEA